MFASVIVLLVFFIAGGMAIAGWMNAAQQAVTIMQQLYSMGYLIVAAVCFATAALTALIVSHGQIIHKDLRSIRSEIRKQDRK